MTTFPAESTVGREFMLSERSSRTTSARVFPLSGGSRRVWLSSRHRDLLETLEAAVRQGRGVLLLTGETGSGKTVLARALLERMAGDDVHVGWLSFPDLDSRGFYTVLADALPGRSSVADDGLEAFRRVLLDMSARGQRLLLVVDEAQALRPELFPELVRLLETEPTAEFNLVLVGQNDLVTMLGDPDHAALAALIAARCTVPPLTADEVGGYVRYHLDAAGLYPNWFTQEAIEELCTRTRGLPRLINVGCDRTLQAAFAASAETIDAQLVAKFVGEEMPEFGRGPQPADEERGARPAISREVVETRRPRRGSVAVAVALLLVGLAAGALIGGTLFYGRRPSPSPSATSPEPIASPSPMEAQTTPAAPRPTATIDTASAPAPVVVVPEEPRTAESAVRPVAPPPSAPAPVTVRTASSPAAAPPKPSRKPPVTVAAPALPPAPSPSEAAVPAVARPTRADEPDASAIIDWLLKQSPRPPD